MSSRRCSEPRTVLVLRFESTETSFLIDSLALSFPLRDWKARPRLRLRYGCLCHGLPVHSINSLARLVQPSAQGLCRGLIDSNCPQFSGFAHAALHVYVAQPRWLHSAFPKSLTLPGWPIYVARFPAAPLPVRSIQPQLFSAVASISDRRGHFPTIHGSRCTDSVFPIRVIRALFCLSGCREPSKAGVAKRVVLALFRNFNLSFPY